MINVIMSCAHRTPRRVQLDTFCEALESIINGMSINKSIYNICGYVNVDLLNNNLNTGINICSDVMYGL